MPPSTVKLLPSAFSDLEPLMAKWCLETNMARYRTRCECSMDELRAFYDVMRPRMEEILAWLDRMPLKELPEEDRRLLRLCFALSEVALAVEVYKEPVLRLAPPAHRFVITVAGMTVD